MPPSHNSPALPDPPSTARLVRATLAAAALAGALLVTVILPAEYGIDPTGVGGAMGLYRAPAPAVDPLPERSAGGEPGARAGAGSLLKSATPFRTDEMSVTLAPGEGAEIKAEMSAGQRMVFSWTSAGGGVDVDMHGESLDRAEGDRSYWAGEFETEGHGAFEAPIAGHHGWFWQNLNDTPVTVTVKTSGFYRRLFRP